MWPWYLGWCYHTPLQCPHHSRPCNYTGTRLQLSAKYIISRGAKILFMWERERYLTEFWAQEVWRLLVLSESWHSWHYHKQTWGKKTVKLTHKNIFISNTIQIEPRTDWEHNWLLDEEFMIIRGMLFVIQSWLFRSSLLLWTVIDNLILGRTQCSQTLPWPGPEPSSRWLRVGRKQNQWEQ